MSKQKNSVTAVILSLPTYLHSQPCHRTKTPRLPLELAVQQLASLRRKGCPAVLGRNSLHIAPLPSRLSLYHWLSRSHGHFHLDGLVGRVPLHLQVLVLEGVDVGLVGDDGQGREGAGLALELLPERVHVVDVDVGVADGVDEVSGLKPARLRARSGTSYAVHGQTGQGSDVKATSAAEARADVMHTKARLYVHEDNHPRSAEYVQETKAQRSEPCRALHYLPFLLCRQTRVQQRESIQMGSTVSLVRRQTAIHELD